MSMIKSFSKAQKIIMGIIGALFLLCAYLVIVEMQQNAKIAAANPTEEAIPHAKPPLLKPNIDWYDEKLQKKGQEIYFTVCKNCHSLSLVRYSDTNTPILASPYDAKIRELMDDDSNFKDKVDRESARNYVAAQQFATPVVEKQLAATYGKVPPDLSLITKARRGGAYYVYSFLSGFEKNEECEENGTQGNIYFEHGVCTAMPNVVGNMTPEDKQAIVAYLNMKAEPFEQQRFAMGPYVIGYCLIMAWFLFLYKKEIWRPIKTKKKKSPLAGFLHHETKPNPPESYAPPEGYKPQDDYKPSGDQ